MTQLITISVQDFEKQWIKDQKLSPTKLFKQKIFELMNEKDVDSTALYAKIERLQLIISKYAAIIEKYGLTEEVTGILFSNPDKLLPRRI